MYLVLALVIIVILIIACSIGLIVLWISNRRQDRATAKSSEQSNRKDAEQHYFLAAPPEDFVEIPLSNDSGLKSQTLPRFSKSQSFIEASDNLFSPPRFASLRYSNRRRSSYGGNTHNGTSVQTLPVRKLSLDETSTVGRGNTKIPLANVNAITAGKQTS